MRYLLFFLLFTSFCFGQKVTNVYVEQASGTSLLDPPLSANVNTELVTGNALAFGTDEVNGTANIVFAGNVSSELVDDGYAGDYVMRYTSPSAFNSFQTTTLDTASGATDYEWAVLVRRVSGTGTLRIRQVVNGSTSDLRTGVADTSFTIYDYTVDGVISVPDGQTVALNFLATDSGDVWEIKASLKAQ